MNVVNFAEPITLTLQVNNKFEECYKVLIKCLDDMTTWTGSDANVLDWSTCRQSSGAAWQMYKW